MWKLLLPIIFIIAIKLKTKDVPVPNPRITMGTCLLLSNNFQLISKSKLTKTVEKKNRLQQVKWKHAKRPATSSQTNLKDSLTRSSHRAMTEINHQH